MPTLEENTTTLEGIGDNGRFTCKTEGSECIYVFRCALDDQPYAVEHRVVAADADEATDVAALLTKVQADQTVIDALAAGWT